MLAGLLAGLAGWIVAAYYGNISLLDGRDARIEGAGRGRDRRHRLGAGRVPRRRSASALIEAGWSAYFDITARDIVVFSLLIVVFVLRPGGLLGFRGPEARGRSRSTSRDHHALPTSRRRGAPSAAQVLRTPMLPAPRLSALTGAQVFVKYENLQVTNSFKERGALNKLASLERGGARARRDRDVGRQSCAGGRLSRARGSAFRRPS